VDFDLEGEAIPALYDEFDRAAAAHFGREEDPDLVRTFYYSTIGAAPADTFRLRFARVAHLSQMPSVDLEAEARREKGADLTEEDRRELHVRLVDARRWLQTYAPPAYRFEVQASLPEAAQDLSDEQRHFLADLVALIEQGANGDELHAAIHVLKGVHGLAPKAAFGAIYQAFLGKESGPQAGWFLVALDRRFVVNRLREAAGQSGENRRT
jgi:lysyl-tRNA synthetase class 1